MNLSTGSLHLSMLLLISGCAQPEFEDRSASSPLDCIENKMGGQLFYAFSRSPRDAAVTLLESHHFPGLYECLDFDHRNADLNIRDKHHRVWEIANGGLASSGEKVWVDDLSRKILRAYAFPGDVQRPPRLSISEMIGILNELEYFHGDDQNGKIAVRIDFKASRDLDQSLLISHPIGHRRKVRLALVLQLLYQHAGVLHYVDRPSAIIFYRPVDLLGLD